MWYNDWLSRGSQRAIVPSTEGQLGRGKRSTVSIVYKRFFFVLYSELFNCKKVTPINSEIREKQNLNQWRNTSTVIKWFKEISGKDGSKFMQLDIVDFYPSITEKLLDKSISFAKSIVTIDDSTIEIINHARKSLLFADGSTWIKRDGNIWDVTQGAYDGAECAELVGLFLLHNMRERFPAINFGLYRDDGMGVYKNLPGPETERLKKNIINMFKENELQITIDMCMNETNFLDVTFLLRNETYKPFRKPNNETLFINRQFNHPPTIIKQLPSVIEKRISELSCNETEFNAVKEDYESALKNSGFNEHLKFNRPEQKNRNRKRNIIYFNPPFNAAVTCDIGHQFLKLIDKHFPPHNKYRILFHRNTVKLSYSCTPNMSAIISTHNKSILAKSTVAPEPLPCNCRNACPMGRTGECRLTNIIYQATHSGPRSPICGIRVDPE